MMDNHADSNQRRGHRQRLRSRFMKDPDSLSQIDLLELLLSYVVQRVDVKPLAVELLDQYGSIQSVISSSPENLLQVNGVGEQVLIFLKVMERVIMQKATKDQPSLFEDLNAVNRGKTIRREKHVFTDDETQNTIQLLPMVTKFSTLDEFRLFLRNNLPYNSESTRIRRMNYILHRFFPEKRLDIPLVHFLSNSKSQLALKSVIFYTILKAESLPHRIANDLIYPNLPLGFVRRSQLTEFIHSAEPEITKTSIEKSINAINSLYVNCDKGIIKDNKLIFHQQICDLEAFLYVFSAEFSIPGMYTFKELFESPVHRWMLWDKNWIVQQLYNLRDLGIISKVSEIDNFQQFSLGMVQMECLKLFYKNPKTVSKIIREQSNQEDRHNS